MYSRAISTVYHSLLRAPPRPYQPNSGLLRACFSVMPNHPAGGIDIDDSRKGEDMADATKRMASSVADIGLDLGEKAKKTMDETWDAAKETTKNVRDAVVGDSKPNQEMHNQPTDSSVEDLRKRPGGYD